MSADEVRNAAEYDVAVVGAGPGGSAAAIGLAQAGWRVLLVDKAAFPRDKVCGDFLSPRSLRVLEALRCREAVEAARPNRIKAASLYLNGEPVTQGVIPQVEDLSNYGYTLPRLVFDDVLFRQAQYFGADTLERCEVTRLETDAEGVTLHAKRAGDAITFRAALVIAADGAHSVLGKQLGFENRDSSARIVALRAYFEGVEGDPGRAEIFFDKTYFPGYAWIFPLADGRANAGLGIVQDVYQRYDINLRERLMHWVENDAAARARLGKARMDGRIVGWPLPTYRPRAGGNYAERVMLIGDAGSFIDPINGEGIHTALESARIAAAVADEALRAGQFGTDFLARYERAWRAAFDLDLRTSDFIVSVVKNRPMVAVWLLVLKMIGEKALHDEDYAATCGGILSGVVPTHQSLSADIVVKTLLNGPDFWGRQVGLEGSNGLPGAVQAGVSAGLAVAGEALGMVGQLARRPAETITWGLDVAAKGLGVIGGMIRGMQSGANGAHQTDETPRRNDGG